MTPQNKCKKRSRVLCSFEVTVNVRSAQVEVCIFCSKRVIYNKHPVTGLMDHRQYLADHLRDTAQPFGRTAKTFERIYGRNELKRLRQMYKSQRSKTEIWGEMKDLTKKMDQENVPLRR